MYMLYVVYWVCTHIQSTLKNCFHISEIKYMEINIELCNQILFKIWINCLVPNDTVIQENRVTTRLKTAPTYCPESILLNQSSTKWINTVRQEYWWPKAGWNVNNFCCLKKSIHNYLNSNIFGINLSTYVTLSGNSLEGIQS